MKISYNKVKEDFDETSWQSRHVVRSAEPHLISEVRYTQSWESRPCVVTTSQGYRPLYSSSEFFLAHVLNPIERKEIEYLFNKKMLQFMEQLHFVSWGGSGCKSTRKVLFKKTYCTVRWMKEYILCVMFNHAAYMYLASNYQPCRQIMFLANLTKYFKDLVSLKTTE